MNFISLPILSTQLQLCAPGVAWSLSGLTRSKAFLKEELVANENQYCKQYWYEWELNPYSLLQALPPGNISSKEALLQLRLERRRHKLHLYQLSDLLLFTNGEKQPGITCHRASKLSGLAPPLGPAAPFLR